MEENILNFQDTDEQLQNLLNDFNASPSHNNSPTFPAERNHLNSHRLESMSSTSEISSRNESPESLTGEILRHIQDLIRFPLRRSSNSHESHRNRSNLQDDVFLNSYNSNRQTSDNNRDTSISEESFTDDHSYDNNVNMHSKNSDTSPNTSTSISPEVETPSSIGESDESKVCWICFNDNEPHRMVDPCHCRGDTKWAHQNCLMNFIIRKYLELTESGDISDFQRMTV